MNQNNFPPLPLAIAVLGSFLLSSCTSFGSHTVARDRFDYNTAIANSWKEQTLLNIVKLRYADMPLFVEVASIVNSYSLEGSVALGGTLSSRDAVQRDFFSFGTAAKYTDRPTITYVPITGQQFNKNFMTPIPPRAVLFLMQSGWPVDLIFPITVDAINGLRAEVTAGANARQGDSDYYRVITPPRKLQKAGAVGMQIVKGKNNQDVTIMFFHRRELTAEVVRTLREIETILGLKAGVRELRVTYGLFPKSDSEIVLLTRSMLHIMIRLATLVSVPSEHVTEGRTVPSLAQNSGIKEDSGRLIEISHSTEKPEDAFTAVRYRDYWFWIDDRDFKSKRAFAFLMILFSLTETGGKAGLPLVTIPAS